MMSAQEIEKLHDLPEQVTIFRGFTGGFQDGMAWTLSKRAAQKFAENAAGARRKKLYGQFGEGPPKIVTGDCSKRDIIALTESDSERGQGIITFPENVLNKVVEDCHPGETSAG